MGVIFLICVIVYVAFAIVFVRNVWKREERRVLRWLAVAFVILLPSWDALLGIIVYYTACPFVSKEAVYETAETDGIYYEGGPRSRMTLSDVLYLGERTKEIRISFADHDLQRGYQYVESRATIEWEYGRPDKSISPPQIYRCMALPADPRKPEHIYQKCISVNDIRSRYMVQTKMYDLFIIEIDSINIHNRETGKLMGEYREIRRAKINFPFFGWLMSMAGYKGGPIVTCPERSRLYDFQFEILKVNRSH